MFLGPDKTDLGTMKLTFDQRREVQYRFLREYLRKARRIKGISQKDLSALLNRHPSFFSHFERGDSRLDVFEFVVICESLDVSTHTLISMANDFADEYESIMSKD